MGAQLDLAKTRLYDDASLKAGNIKLFPGTSRDTTAEQMAEQINKALSQISTGHFQLVEDESQD